MKYLKTCCFIDYSYSYKLFEQNENPNMINFKYRLKEITKSLVKDFYVTNFVSGMELGFEQFFAESVLEFKEEYPQITLEAVLPYETFPIKWNEIQRDKYYSIMQQIDKETLMQYRYTKECIRKRNLYMINKSNYIILLCNNTSEIYNLTLYARSNKKIVFIMESDTLNIKPQLRIYK